jgi:eukaryotic-like serine/threonine-protein kinase
MTTDNTLPRNIPGASTGHGELDDEVTRIIAKTPATKAAAGTSAAPPAKGAYKAPPAFDFKPPAPIPDDESTVMAPIHGHAVPAESPWMSQADAQALPAEHPNNVSPKPRFGTLPEPPTNDQTNALPNALPDALSNATSNPPSNTPSNVSAQASSGVSPDELHPLARLGALAAPGLVASAVAQLDDGPALTLPAPTARAALAARPDTGSTLSPRSAGQDGSGETQVRQVGRFLVQSRLGRGGMATVYRAQDPSIGRDVAIKFLHASLSEDDECRMRFLREARAAGALSHPNIVVVHDVGEIDHRPYMAMELVEGAPLSDILEKTPVMPIRDTVFIGLQLARALDYAHAKGIVHRDIKPGNIMLMPADNSIKVTDFGIAHMDSGDDERTVVGSVMGTPQYMSPEQTRGDKVDGRSDLFSAGIVMYQMLAGRRPFRGDSLVAVATQIATAEAAPLNQARPDVPPSLRRVVDRCLAKQPAQRYQSGKELADALVKELVALDEAAREKDKPRMLSLRVKWAATMALIVAVVMGLTSAVINQRQYAAMLSQVSDQGASLARFIAAQNATSVLADEWDAVDVAVQEMMKTRNFERVSVVDRTGLVRVSSQASTQNQPYVALGVPVDVLGGATVRRYESAGESVLGFEAPILFQDKQIGRVTLGIAEAPLTRVARLSMVLMGVLLLVTVLAVAIAMYIVANWFAKPIRLVSESMAEIGKGRFDHRIAEVRSDEFGELFNAFDKMAGALQTREPGSPPSPLTVLPAATRAAEKASGEPNASPVQDASASTAAAENHPEIKGSP